MIAACLAPIEAISPDLEKQGFFAVGFLIGNIAESGKPAGKNVLLFRFK